MIIINFPRAGGNFLKNIIYDQTEIRVEYKHTIDISDNNIISIVRDPIESFASGISMGIQINNHKSYLNDTKFNNTMKVYIQKYIIPKYTLLQEELLSRDTFFINYIDLSKIDIILDKIYHRFSVKSLDIPLNIDLVKSKLIDVSDYQVSSKNNHNYYRITKVLNEMDLSMCYDLYTKSINRCISI